MRGEKCGEEYLSQSDSDGEASGQDGNWGGVEGRKWPRQREEAGAEDKEVVEEVEGDWESCTTSTDHPLNIQAAHMEGEGDERRQGLSRQTHVGFSVLRFGVFSLPRVRLEN